MAIVPEGLQRLQHEIEAGNHKNVIWTSRLFRKHATGLRSHDIAMLERKGVIIKPRRCLDRWLVWTSEELYVMLGHCLIYCDALKRYEADLLRVYQIRKYIKNISEISIKFPGRPDLDAVG